MLNRYSCE